MTDILEKIAELANDSYLQEKIKGDGLAQHKLNTIYVLATQEIKRRAKK